MKILVTGARGFIGARIMDEFPDAVAAPSLRAAGEAEIRRMVDAAEAELIIHTAAISDIPTCEKDPEGSYRANVLLPLWLVKSGVKTVLFSTDQVYAGCGGEGPYGEEGVRPANLYGRHKLEMERRALEAAPDTVLLRASWMYDMPRYGSANRGNFLVNMLRERELAFSASQHRAVTYARSVAAHMRRAAELPGGVYNYGSENGLTMLETACWLRDALELPVILRDAGARHDLWMDCSKAKRRGICFDSSIDGLRRCILDYGLRRRTEKE